jgi:hypothetical protein
VIEYAYFFVNTENKGFDAVAVASVATAIMALIVSIIAWRTSNKQLQQNMNHNRLSVRPIISSIQAYEPEKKTLSISIVNGGLGPTQIKGMKILIDKCAINSPRAMAEVVTTLTDDLDIESPFVELIGKDHTIRSGDKINLITFKCNEDVAFEFLSRFEQRCRVELIYFSVYSETFFAYFPEHEEIFNAKN